MAALVDSAASLGVENALGDSRACKASHRHSSSAHSDTPSSQPRHRGISMPGAAPAGQQPGSSTACLATLQALAECCCVVLQCAASGEAQAGLLAACVRRALMGSMSEAVCVLQLLRMVLRHVGASSTSAACMQLHQVSKGCVSFLQQGYSVQHPCPPCVDSEPWNTHSVLAGACLMLPCTRRPALTSSCYTSCSTATAWQLHKTSSSRRCRNGSSRSSVA